MAEVDWPIGRSVAARADRSFGHMITSTVRTRRPRSGQCPGDRPPHRLRSALALVLLAPLVGEFLLGNQPVTALPGLLLLAPLYGCGALLIREAARRAGRGWPTMVLLAAAYALIEEGPVDQMLWNPHYGGVDFGLAYAGTHVSWLGTSVALVQEVLALHTVWSICVPIALVEAFRPAADRTRPWLGRPGLGVTALLFLAAAFLLGDSQHTGEHFMASPGQFAGAAVAVVVLVAAAFTRLADPARPRPVLPGAPPTPRRVGVAAFTAASLYWAKDVVLPESASSWLPVAAWCALAGGMAWACARWSRRAGWGDRHRLALAGGALLTYVWLGFVHAQEMGVPPLLALSGNVLFGAGAVLLLGAAVRRLSVRRPGEPPPTRDTGGVSPREIGRRTTAGPGDTRTNGHRIRTALDERRTHGARIGERPQ